jgi:hypothetical protein
MSAVNLEAFVCIANLWYGPQSAWGQRSWSEESKKKISESMKRYYRNKCKIGKDKEVGDNKSDD